MGKNQTRPKASQSLAVRPSTNSAGKRRRADPDDIAESFKDMVGLTFIFLSGRVCEHGPDVLCSTALLYYGTRDMPYRSPFPDNQFWDGGFETERERVQIEKAVESRLAMLRRAGISYALCWNVVGQDKVRFDCSDDYRNNIIEDISHFVAHELTSDFCC